jgi:hypothetical protein
MEIEMAFEDFGFELDMTFIQWHNDVHDLYIGINPTTSYSNNYDLFHMDCPLLIAKSQEEIFAYLSIYFRKQKIKKFLNDNQD